MADVGPALSELCSLSKALSVSFADMAGQMQGIISYLCANIPSLNGTELTYDPSIIDHALHVRQQRDEMFRATTSRDTEP
jgi:hypothetical protein